MKKNVKHLKFILYFLILGLTLNLGAVYADTADGTIEADMGIMDDFGNVLYDYTKQTFEIRNDYFIYRKPPVLDRYTFATANVLKLETDKGVTYRVNYFYTLDSNQPGDLPESFPMSQMPMKKTAIEEKDVMMSWTDESMRELTDSKSVKLDYYWDTFDLKTPKEISGYGFQKIVTGTKTVNGEKMPQIVYVYKRDARDQVAPSLIFGHLIGEAPVSTLKPEVVPSQPSTKPQTVPKVTKPSAPPSTKPDAGEMTAPSTKPAATASGNSIPANTNAGHTQAPYTTSGTGKPQSSGESTGSGTSTAVFLLGLASLAAVMIYSKIRK